MATTEPDPFPTQWTYSLVKNFSREGVEAAWARGSPQPWSAADSVISSSEGARFNRIAVSPDGKYLAAGNADAVKIFEIHDNGARERFSFPPQLGAGTLNHLEWANDDDDSDEGQNNTLVISIATVQPGMKREARVGVYAFSDNLTSIRLVQKWNCFSWPLRSLKMLDTSGRRLLVLPLPEAEASTTGGGGNLEIWSWRQQTRLHSLDVRSDDISWLSFSPNGQLVAVAGKDRILRIFDVVSGNMRSFTGVLKGSQINGGAFSPDGNLIACSCSAFGADAAAVQIFDLDGQNLHNLPFQPMTRSLAWSPDGKMLAYGAQGGYLDVSVVAQDPSTTVTTVQSWHLDYPGIRPSPLNEPAAIQFVDAGTKLLFATGMEGGVEMYDFDSNLKYRFEPDDGQSEFQLGTMRSLIAWSQHWKTVVCLDGDGCIRFWKI
ncbi:uncharacterized protein N0V89_011608 [Didymosphaeria variabile]|uniref:Peptidase S9A N-terminal domain-containing protein n=1 Tax=Didymosphaeria variabile TaxID=1932322 RepID=A0A9W8XA36_9PLEO|nr:uncharacterized protein N0V89_011608 [Didymosphaeria variabile]KAJ4345476.1 hypothetical protein N0V89_011608 [Didymosphaeria variabile]